MNIIYILRSLKSKSRIYIGFTQDLDNRLNEHNRGDSTYTKKFAPWEVETKIIFKNKNLALKFEKYLKEGSGHAFLRKRLIS